MADAFPGMSTPAVGFEQPYEMLEACHARVQRTLTLLGRLLDHVRQNGHDQQSRSAAADVLRYFDLAAPLHHLDEEEHVFPLLLKQGDPALQALVGRLLGEHRRMESLWGLVRQPLLRWCEPGCAEQPDQDTQDVIAQFRSLYGQHIANEEGMAFPAARSGMDEATLAAMGRQMQARRQP